MHAGMLAIGARSNLLQMTRMNIENADDSAALVGRNAQGKPLIRLLRLGRGDGRRSLAGAPELVELDQAFGAMVKLGQATVASIWVS